MPPVREEKNLVRAVTEDGEYCWEECLAASENKLLVVDCHRDWCGPCETLHPTFTRISLETTESEERCLFVAANLDNFAELVQAQLPKDTSLDLASHGCMPLVVLLRERVAVATIEGCNAPAISREINKHMPTLKTEDEDAEYE